MKPLRDPEKAELSHLLTVCELTGQAVLEIGCGDGVFTRQYSRSARHVVGIDPLASEVKIAKKKARYGRSSFLQGNGQNLPFSDHIFDITLFASSL